MPAAAFNKFNQFVEDLAHGVHDFESDQLVLALTNAAPVATDAVLAALTQIDYTNLSSRNLTTSTSEGSDGSYELVVGNNTLTASGGSVGPFRYVVLYNDTPTTPADPLIGWFDYGSSITLGDAESILVKFDAAANVLTIL